MRKHIQNVREKVKEAKVIFSPITQEALDKILKADFDIPEAMNPTNLPEAKMEFLSNPELRLPNFEFTNIERKAAELSPIMVDLMRYFRQKWERESALLPEAEKSLVESLYFSVIDKYRFLQTVKVYNLSETKTEDLTRAFYNLQTSVFAPPEKAVFRSTLASELRAVREKVSLFTRDDLEKLGELRQLLGDLWQLCEPEVAPSEEQGFSVDDLLKRYRDILQGYLGQFLATIPDTSEDGEASFSADEVCDWLNETLQTILVDKEGKSLTRFRAVVSDEVSNLSVNQQERLIKIPLRRAVGKYSHKDFVALILGHEFGTHILRGVPFEDCEFKMLSTGLPGYLDFEEGIACCTEMALRGKTRAVGYAHYINIGLAYFEKKDFRSIFEIRARLSYLSGVKAKETPEDKEQRWLKAQNLAFAQATRCFRGTGSLVNCKDLTYYNGYVKTLRFIAAFSDQPEELMKWLFWSGKIDATNAMHRDIVAYVLGES